MINTEIEMGGERSSPPISISGTFSILLVASGGGLALGHRLGPAQRQRRPGGEEDIRDAKGDTNTCLNVLASRRQRLLPDSNYPPGNPAAPLAAPILEPVWLQPVPDTWLPEALTDPEARYASERC